MYKKLLMDIFETFQSPMHWKTIVKHFCDAFIGKFEFPSNWQARLLKAVKRMVENGELFSSGHLGLYFSVSNVDRRKKRPARISNKSVKEVLDSETASTDTSDEHDLVNLFEYGLEYFESKLTKIESDQHDLTRQTNDIAHERDMATQQIDLITNRLREQENVLQAEKALENELNLDLEKLEPIIGAMQNELIADFEGLMLAREAVDEKTESVRQLEISVQEKNDQLIRQELMEYWCKDYQNVKFLGYEMERLEKILEDLHSEMEETLQKIDSKLLVDKIGFKNLEAEVCKRRDILEKVEFLFTNLNK